MASVKIGDMVAVAIAEGSYKKERRGIVIERERVNYRHGDKEWTYTVEWLDSNERTKVYESDRGSQWFMCSLATRKAYNTLKE
jgi:hypothetical protein